MTTPFPYGLSMLKVRNLTNVLQQKLQLGFRCLAICCFCSCVVFGGESFSEEKRVVTIGVLDSSLSATDKSAIAQTLEALENLPGYRLDVQYYNPSELDEQLIQKKLDYFIGTSGFYRRFQSFGLRSVATLFTETAPNPRYATGSVFVVRNDSPIKTISELKGKSALASWSKGFSSYFAPMGEIANELGTSKVTNVVSLGVLASVCEIVSRDYLALGVEKVLGEKKKSLLPLNIKALNSLKK